MSKDIKTKYGTHYTEEEILFLKEHEDGTKEKRKWIANQLGRTFWSVDHKVCKMGWGRNECIRWTNKEKDWLEKNGQKYSLLELCDKLYEKFGIKRSPNAVNVQCKNLSIKRKIKHGWYSTGDVANLLGCTSTHIRDEIKSGRLKAKIRVSQTGVGDYEIVEDSLCEYIVSYLQGLSEYKNSMDVPRLLQILNKGKRVVVCKTKVIEKIVPQVVEKIVYKGNKFLTHNTFKMHISKEEWDTFVWQREECSRIQGNCCVNCGLQKVCESLYNKVGEYYKYFETKIYETEGVAGAYNPCVEGHSDDLMDSLQKRTSNKLTILDVKAIAPMMGSGKK